MEILTTLKKCVICGKEFKPHNKKQECCGTACALEKTKRYQIAHRKMRICKCCGKEFWTPNGAKNKQNYCSTECRKKYFRLTHPIKIKVPKPKIKKVCEWCGKEFEASWNNQKFCSHNCSYQNVLDKERNKWKLMYKPKKYICKECGKEFMTECGDTHSVFCSSACSKTYEKRMDRQTTKYKERTKLQKEKREKQIKENFIDNVKYEIIFKRDNGICKICGLPVKFEKKCDNNWDGTIDHIIPLSKGGKHSYDNCQLSHRICNSLKGQDSNKKINWEELSKKDLYWKRKFDAYKKLMFAGAVNISKDDFSKIRSWGPCKVRAKPEGEYPLFNFKGSL